MTAIFQALSAGHTPQAILRHVAQMNPQLANQITAAINAGHSLESIVKFMMNNGDKISKQLSTPESNNLYKKAQQSIHPAIPNMAKAGLTAAAIGAGAYGLHRAATAASAAIQPSAILPALKPQPGKPLQLGYQSPRGLPRPGGQVPPTQPQSPTMSPSPPQPGQSPILPAVNPAPGSPPMPQPTTPQGVAAVTMPKMPPMEVLNQIGVKEHVDTMLKRGNPPEGISAAITTFLRPNQKKWYMDEMKKGTIEPLEKVVSDYITQQAPEIAPQEQPIIQPQAQEQAPFEPQVQQPIEQAQMMQEPIQQAMQQAPVEQAPIMQEPKQLEEQEKPRSAIEIQKEEKIPYGEAVRKAEKEKDIYAQKYSDEEIERRKKVRDEHTKKSKVLPKGTDADKVYGIKHFTSKKPSDVPDEVNKMVDSTIGELNERLDAGEEFDTFSGGEWKSVGFKDVTDLGEQTVLKRRAARNPILSVIDKHIPLRALYKHQYPTADSRKRYSFDKFQKSFEDTVSEMLLKERDPEKYKALEKSQSERLDEIVNSLKTDTYKYKESDDMFLHEIDEILFGKKSKEYEAKMEKLIKSIR